MFIARENELKQLNALLEESNKAIVVYGKRRIGKTALIKKAIQSCSKPYVYFECVNTTMENNVALFVEELKKVVDIKPYITFKTLFDVFNYIKDSGLSINIVFDEYPYLKEFNDAKYVDSLFQNIVDNYLDNLNLIICGSQVRMMEDLLVENNPLFGRFNCVLRLREMDYLDAAKFYQEKTTYDKIGFYAVFGGSPMALINIRSTQDLKTNIINTFLNETSAIYNHADYVLISDATNVLQAKRILQCLGNSKKKYSEIEDELDKEKTGKINRALKALQDLDIVRKVFPINKPNDVKKAYYEISDNLMRFFYKYINPNRNDFVMLSAEAFYEKHIEPSLKTFISYRFEDIVRTYYSLCSKKGLIKSISAIGTYYYDDVKNHKNGEFDVALEIDKKQYKIVEAKYYDKHPLKLSEMQKEVEQIKSIKEIEVKDIAFISTSGYEESNFECLNIDKLYSI